MDIAVGGVRIHRLIVDRFEEIPLSNAAKRKTIYLHIGWEKTGSSAIQAFCGRNRDWLAEHGFDYPSFGNSSNHALPYHEIASREPKRIDHSIQQMKSIVDTSPHASIIFSHESFHLCNPVVFQHMFSGHDLKVIAYLRQPEQAIISHFVTMIRFGNLNASDLHRAVRSYTRRCLTCFDYYWQLEAFAAVFGHESMIVREYHEDKLVGAQSVSDFMSLIGIANLENSAWPTARANPSLNIDQFTFVLRAARLLRHLPPPQVQRNTRKICDALLKNTKNDQNQPIELFVSPSLKNRINSFFSPSLELLYQHYFDGQRVFSPPEQSEPLIHDLSNAKCDQMCEQVLSASSLPASIRHQLNAINTPLESELLNISLKSTSLTASIS